MKNIKGYLLLEVVIAMVIFVMIGLSIFTSIGFMQLRIKKSEFSEEAVAVMQESMEIAQNAILVDWNKLEDGTYHPSEDLTSDSWVLVPGAEEGYKARYERSIGLETVCRNSEDGIKVSCPTGVVDNNSRLIKGYVSWKEGGVEKKIESTLLSFKVPG